MFKKRDTGLVEFEDSNQASIAKANLNGIPFFSSVLQVNDSKLAQIQIPSYIQNKEEQSLTADFTGSKEHRYKIQGSKNVQNITVSFYCIEILVGPFIDAPPFKLRQGFSLPRLLFQAFLLSGPSDLDEVL